MEESSSLRDLLNSAERAEKSKNYLLASNFYKQALAIAKKMNDASAIKLCKKKIVETNKKSDSEFKTLTFEHVLSEEQTRRVRSAIDSLLVGDFHDVLKRIGLIKDFVPSYAEALRIAKENMPISAWMASNSVISNEGHLMRGGSDGERVWQWETYSRNYSIIWQLYLMPIFRKLVRLETFSREGLQSYFRTKSIFTDRDLEILDVGLERYCSGDYVSALCVLVPKFEGVFMLTCGQLGLDIIAAEQNQDPSTRYKTLSPDFLINNSTQRIWGEDYCWLIQLILIEPLGYRLRHKVAHGELDAREANFTTASMVLHLYLLLFARVKPLARK